MGFVCSVHTFPQFLAVALVLGGDAQILGVPRPVTLVQGSLSSSLFRLPRFDKDDGAFKVTWPVRSKTAGTQSTIKLLVEGFSAYLSFSKIESDMSQGRMSRERGGVHRQVTRQTEGS